MPSISINDLSPLGPPISNLTGRVYIICTAVVFTFTASSTTRPLYLKILSVLLLGGNIYFLLTMPDIMGHIPGLDPLIANFIVVWWMRAVDLFFLRDESRLLEKKQGEFESNENIENKKEYSPEDRRKMVQMKRKFASMSPFRAFDYLVVNHRMIGTPFEVRGIQSFDNSRPHWTPNRNEFIAMKMKHLVLAYLTLDLLVTQQPAPPQRLFSRDQEFFFSRIQEVTLEEVGFRWLTSINLWASCTCLIQYIYAAVSVLGVGSGIYEPREFPPLLGDLGRWYSVRNHWGYVLTRTLHL